MKLTIYKEHNGTFLRNETGGLVASMEAGYQQTREEQAVFIVRACVAHAPLVAALSDFVKCHAEGGYVLPDYDVIAAARAALALGDGESK